jgi:magnesium transporter
LTDPTELQDDAPPKGGGGPRPLGPEEEEAVRAEPEAASTDNPYGVDDAMVKEIEGWLDEARLDKVERAVTALHSADVADVLEMLHPEDRVTVVGIIRPTLGIDAEVLTHLNEEVRDQILGLLDPEEIARALGELESDDALELIEGLDDDARVEILSHLPVADRMLVEEGLTFPEYSAGRLMQREVVAVPMFWTVGKTIDWLRAAKNLPDDFYQIFTVDPRHHIAGGASLSRIMRSKRSVRLADIMDAEIRTIPAAMDQEEVAYLFRQYGLVSAPVVDDDGRLLGVVTVDDVVEVIDEEHEDDLLKLGGVQEIDVYRAVLRTTRSRFTWLSVNLLTAVLASGVIAIFEGTIQQAVALAVLMPIVASMGGNAGTQTLTVTVRGIAMHELEGRAARKFVLKELAVGTLNGLGFALVGGAIAALWFGDILLGGVIGMAMVITLIVAGLTGALIPMALDKLKIDPAVASSIFLTTVTDVVGFFTFLGLAAVILL